MVNSLQNKCWDAGFVNKGVEKVCVGEWVREKREDQCYPVNKILGYLFRSLTAIVVLLGSSGGLRLVTAGLIWSEDGDLR